MRLYLLSGAPGSGKSTYAKEWLKDHPEATYISRDEIRFSFIKDGDGYFSKEKQVFREFARAAKAVLDNGGTVLLDATHLNIRSVKKILNALQWNEEFGIIRLEVPLEVLLERNSHRLGRQYVPEDKLIEMFNRLDDATEYCDNVCSVINMSREEYRKWKNQKSL